ncbi:MAG: D-alanyl-D-alanine carboxypeptidase, partial [Terriglobales bacterium]
MRGALPRALLLYAAALTLAAPGALAAEKKTRAKPLAERIEAILAEPDLARGHWGIEVVSLASGRTLYSRNAGQLFLPASNTKLLVTAAALELIGPDFRHRTTVETTGPLD